MEIKSRGNCGYGVHHLFYNTLTGNSGLELKYESAADQNTQLSRTEKLQITTANWL